MSENRDLLPFDLQNKLYMALSDSQTRCLRGQKEWTSLIALEAVASVLVHVPGLVPPAPVETGPAVLALNEVRSRLMGLQAGMREAPRDAAGLAALRLVMGIVDDVQRGLPRAERIAELERERDAFLAEDTPRPKLTDEQKVTLRDYARKLEAEEAYRRRGAEEAERDVARAKALQVERDMDVPRPQKTWSSPPGDSLTEEWSRLDLVYDELHQDEAADGTLVHERVLVYEGTDPKRRVTVRYGHKNLGEDAPEFILARRVSDVEFPRASNGPWTLIDPLLTPEEE